MAVAVASAAHAGPGTPASGDALLKRKEALARTFMQNAGQWDSRALFRASTPGLEYWIVRNGAVYDFHTPDGDDSKSSGHVVRMSYVGGRENAVPKGLDKSAVHNQFINERVMADAGDFRRVLTKDIYPGVDALHYFSDKKGVRYDMIAQPGSHPDKIRLRFSGAQGLRIDNKGDLRLKTSLGEMGMGGLYVYQDLNGARKAVPARFKLFGKDQAGFEIGKYDHSKPLVIDPLVYGSYFGGDNGSDKVTGVVSEPDGAIYMTGYTASRFFPSQQGAYQEQIAGGRDAFVTRFRGDAYDVDYNSFLGGSAADEGRFIVMDPSGKSIYILGVTQSTNLLANPNLDKIRSRALQPTKKNATDWFIFRFDKSGATGLKPGYASYFAPESGVFDNPDPVGFAMTPNGTLLVAGETTGVMPKAKNDPAEGPIFVAAFSKQGTAYKYSTYFGSFHGRLGGMAIDKTGHYYLAGTAETGFPLRGRTFPNGGLIRGGTDAFLAKFQAESGSPVPLFSAAIGGSQQDQGFGVAVDQDENAFVLGFSNSFDYPSTPNTYDQETRDQVVVTKVRGDGSQILASTALGTTQDQANMAPVGLAVDGAGNVAITGRLRAIPTFSTPPVEPDAVPNPNVPIGAGTAAIQVTQDDNPNGPNYSPNNYAAKPEYTWINDNAVDRTPTWDGWVNVFDGNLQGLIYGSYVGGDNDEEIMPPYADLNGDIWLFGRIDTALTYLVPPRPPASGDPPDPIEVLSNSAFYEDLSDPQKPRRFITPLAFKAVPERFPTDFTLNLTGDRGQRDYTALYFDPDTDFAPPYTTPPTVAYATQTDGFVSRFRFGAPTISNIVVNPSTVPGGQGATTEVTVNLSLPAPAQGAEIRLDLSSIDYAQFQGSTNPSTVVIRIAEGETSGTAIVATKPVTTPQTLSISANYRGNVRTSSITVVPWLTQISITPNQLRGGFRTTATITLAAPAPEGGIKIDLKSSNPSILTIANSITIPAGQRTANIEINTAVVKTTTPITVEATFLGVKRTANVTVDPFPFRVNALELSPSTVVSGGTSKATVSINVAAPDNGLRFRVVSSSPYATVPAEVRIGPGATQKAFNIVAGTPVRDRAVKITVTPIGPNGEALASATTATLTVKAVTYNVKLTPDTIVGGEGSVTGILTLDNGAKATEDLSFTLEASPSDAATISPATVKILKGQSSTTFSVTPKTTATAKTIKVFARIVGGATRSNVATLNVGAIQLATLTFERTTLTPGVEVAGTVTLKAVAPAGGVVVTFDLTRDLFASIKPSSLKSSLTVTIPAGQKSAKIYLTSKQLSLPVKTTVTATAGGQSSSVQLTLQR